MELHPFAILAVGIVTVLGLIIALRINAFIALISAAMLVSLLAPGEVAAKISRVATAFGMHAGGIGLVIAMAAVIGKCMLDSGAADRVVRAFLGLLGEKRSPIALMGSGFVLAVPVFFDTVFYLLVPLARSLHRRTGKHYLKYILAIVAGGAVTHTLVPPTPGPLLMASNLNIDLGVMIMIGALVALPAAICGLVACSILDRMMPIAMRPIGTEPEPEPLEDSQLPSLFVSLLPVVLPVLLISANTGLAALANATPGDASLRRWADWSAVVGNPNLALLISTVIAMVTLARQRRLSRADLAQVVEISLMSGGVIILITAAGGAFGEMLKVAGVGEAIKNMFQGTGGTGGILLLCLGFGIAAVLKVAQGSSTVAMITASAMLAGVATPGALEFHPVYLATAIGGGSLIGSWMNDSGFWIFTKMGGLTEVESLKSWTILLLVLGSTSFLTTLLLATLMPLR